MPAFCNKQNEIKIRGAKAHNLKSVDLNLPKGQLIVFSGVSGSGKSSIAFDTIFAEGQRRYVESLSAHVRRHLENLKKAPLDTIEGLSPTMAIEQKTAGKNPRSTVATLTEIHDYLRVLWARLASAYCPISAQPLSAMSQETIMAQIMHRFTGQKIAILAPVVDSKRGEFENERRQWLAQGYLRAYIDDKMLELDQDLKLDASSTHCISLVTDRLTLIEAEKTRMGEAVIRALELAQGTCQVYDFESEQVHLFSTHAYSPQSGLSYKALEPEDFSFNSEKGMCEICHGLGHSAQWNLEKAIDPKKSIAQDCCALATSYQTVRYFNIYRNLARLYNFDVSTPWYKLSQEAKEVFLKGTGTRWLRMEFVHPISAKRWTDRVCWRGVLHEAWERYQGYKTQKAKEAMRAYLVEGECYACHGDRLKPYPAAAKLGGWSLPQFCRLTIAKALKALQSLQLQAHELAIGRELLAQVCSRLEFLCDVGLDYLSLDRTAPTLSGGEAQRVRLSSQIGAGLVGVTYILDEPSIGLHARDNEKLIHTLHRLRDRGSNVIVVEHDEETIISADHVVDFGPGSGSQGGQVVYSGSVEGLLNHPTSLTGSYLSGRQKLKIRPVRKATNQKLAIRGACHHNLKNIDVEIPLGLFVVVTGVSGSGKSSLISETLHPWLINKLHHGQLSVGNVASIEGFESIDKVIGIDQSSIGRLPRSNPATYVKVFDDIRALFSQLPEAKARGYEPGRFSFNVREGSCSNCQGMGYIKLDMDFLNDEFITCPACQGQQFDESTLSITFKDKNIRQVLELSVDQAWELFQDIPVIARKLELLQRVGLGYLPLGQPSPYLSGGEAQRIKLAKELSRPSSGSTLYILDEPTTGLHIHDVARLLDVLHALVEKGNSVLLIEHHMEVIKQADWLIDIGPEGGECGGQLVAQGPPSKVAKIDSPTGKMLKQGLKSFAKEPQTLSASEHNIHLKGVRQHNLKGFDLTIPHSKMSVLCGPSGSGKSSLAIDTLFAAGQRKYVDSLSPYARQFVKAMPQPRVERIEGLCPAIAVEMKETVGNLRSTVGTLTEIYDYLRLLYTRLGLAYCPYTGEKIESVDISWVRSKINSWQKGSRLQILAPVLLDKGETTSQCFNKLAKTGFSRIRIDGQVWQLDAQAQSHLEQQRGTRVKLEVIIDRIKAQETEDARIDSAIELAERIGKGILIINHEQEDTWINMGFCVPSTGASYPAITPQLFAFNTDDGACQECSGIGCVPRFDIAKVLPQIQSTVQAFLEWLCPHAFQLLDKIPGLKKIASKPLCELSSLEQRLLLEEQSLPGLKWKWRGLQAVITKLPQAMLEPLQEKAGHALKQYTCPSCGGSRLNPLARNVLVEGRGLGELTQMELPSLLEFVQTLQDQHQESKAQVLTEVLQQLQARLKFLLQVGLSYLSLDRSAPTLSGGETQRIRLSAQLGAGLSGILYVLDEPSSGLHSQDCLELKNALDRLKNLGNTLVVVDHQPHLIKAADRIYEMGPGASTNGGWVQHESHVSELTQNPFSPTGKFLASGLPFKEKPRISKSSLKIRQANAYELKQVDVDIPLHTLCAITGVSGSGKSTLIEQVLWPILHQAPKGALSYSTNFGWVEGMNSIEQVCFIDAQPLGLTSRSDVGTYAQVLPKLRELLAQMPEAKVKGLKGGNFSPNVKKGMCRTCYGMGYQSVDLRFMPAVRVQCPSCQGMRLNPVSLEVRYSGLNFGQLLQLSIDELAELMSAQPAILRRLKPLQDVGLGYLSLGFEVAHLSIGESQRLKLAARLCAAKRGKHTLFLIDEPCKGLHPSDVAQLQKTLERLVDIGSSIVCIEHNLSFVAACDWMIEMGPGAGKAGGKVVSCGPPIEICNQQIGATGQQLHHFQGEKPLIKKSKPRAKATC